MLNGNGTAPKVVVVGGSLGGLFNAIALRSPRLRGRGLREVVRADEGPGCGHRLPAGSGRVPDPLRSRPAGVRRRPRPHPPLPRSGRLGGAGRADAAGDDFVGHAVSKTACRLRRRPLPRRRPAGRVRDGQRQGDGPVRGRARRSLRPVGGCGRPRFDGAATTPAERAVGVCRVRRLAWRGAGTPSPRPRRRVRRAVHVLPSPAHAHPLLPDPRPGWFAHAGAAAAQLGVVLERRTRRRTRPGADRQGRAAAAVLRAAGVRRPRHGRLAARSGPAHLAASSSSDS